MKKFTHMNVSKIPFQYHYLFTKTLTSLSDLSHPVVKQYKGRG